MGSAWPRFVAYQDSSQARNNRVAATKPTKQLSKTIKPETLATHYNDYTIRGNRWHVGALHFLRVKLHHCETERLQCSLRVVGAPARACNLAPQIVQVCQVCGQWGRPGQPNQLSVSFALPFQEGYRLSCCGAGLHPNQV